MLYNIKLATFSIFKLYIFLYSLLICINQTSFLLDFFTDFIVTFNMKYDSRKFY